MRKLNLYAAGFIIGSSIALLLEVIRVSWPVATAGALPIGGDGFTQSAVCILSILCIAAIYDFFR